MIIVPTHQFKFDRDSIGVKFTTEVKRGESNLLSGSESDHEEEEEPVQATMKMSNFLYEVPEDN